MSDMINIGALERTLDRMQDSISRLASETVDISRRVDNVDSKVSEIRKDLQTLNAEFKKMAEDNMRNANLQRAITELVRVRQEINQKYGNYTVIRQTMIGVLQANDLALVKKTTISRVSEELMLSTPQYWLAPCLVAVAAWISNDRDLAERAITEAMKRDTEKTALAMALICRRNGRVQTGYEWLSIYFERQSATNFTEDSFTYIDAYVNGVFGPDEKHMCQGYVAKWIDEVRGSSSNFESSQENTWREFCCRYSKNTDSEFPDLKDAVPEYGSISSCIGRIQSIGTIQQEFKGITEAYIDQEAMKRAVDAELVRLIGNYDTSELEIRREEEYLSLVKYFNGYEDKAREEMNAREAKRLRRKLDFIAQMSSEITSGKDTTPSKKKTAVTFLSGYINRGAARYISESREAFPDKVTIKLDGWTGTSANGTEFDELSREFEDDMLDARDEAIRFATNVKPKILMIASISMLVLTMIFGIMMIAVKGFPAFFPIASLVTAGILFLYRIKVKNDMEKKIEMIYSNYDNRIEDGKDKLWRILNQWNDAKYIVDEFDHTSQDIQVVA